jgi:hypothetical protein
MAELLPDEQRLAGNTLVSSLTFAATIARPAIAGVLVTCVTSALVLGLDALTYAFLAFLVVSTRLPGVRACLPGRPGGRPRRTRVAGVAPELLGLLTLTGFFKVLYGRSRSPCRFT